MFLQSSRVLDHLISDKAEHEAGFNICVLIPSLESYGYLPPSSRP